MIERVNLRLLEHARPLGERFWYPFEVDDGFTLDWWHHGPAFESHTYADIQEGDEVVARVDLDQRLEVDQ